VEKLLILVPSKLEQDRIAEILDSTDEQIARDKLQLKKLVRQKAGLMHDLLTGKRRVTALLAQAASQ
jgi:type I restriction enzyme S subunit